MNISGQDLFSRTELLLGRDAMQRMAGLRVIVFGVGGVGSWCAEALVRSGVGHLTIVDPDLVAQSNVNRQAMATTKTIGRPKVEALRERLLEINPEAEIDARQEAYKAETADRFDLDSYDCVIDAVDSLSNKAELILNAARSSARFYSSMGAALKLDPTQVRVAEFWNVRGCPLGAALRKRFRKHGTLPAKPFHCVYDEEVLPMKGGMPGQAGKDVAGKDAAESVAVGMDAGKAQINGSAITVTAVFGFTLAWLVIRDIV